MTRLGLSAGLCFLVAACGAAQHPKGKPAQLRVVAVPASAIVQVDEHFVGAARVLERQPVALNQGKHRVTVEAPGYFPHDLEVEMVPGVTSIEIKLRPVPP
jgi:hypothetical protein